MQVTLFHQWLLVGALGWILSIWITYQIGFVRGQGHESQWWSKRMHR